MSMRDYAVDDYGLVLDEEMIKAIASKVFNDFVEDADTHWVYELYDKGICEYVSEFTGEAQKITDDGTFAWGGNYEYYYNDILAYVPLSKYPTLFKKAYSNMDDIISELKSKIGGYLPEDFDYRSKLCHISGTYFG